MSVTYGRLIARCKTERERLVCLWGNSTDLSLLIDMTEEDIKKLQSTGGDHLAATEKNILGNDLHKLADYVATLKGGRIDFVLDNAGFELYCDMVYADWLIQSGICSQVVFHGKKIPWFVSDVTKKDWDWYVAVAKTWTFVIDISLGSSTLVFTAICSTKLLRLKWIR